MDETIIAKIGGLLALCGIASFRSFLPTFLLLVMARLAPGLEDCPQALLDIASQVPEVMLNDGVLALFGVLAAAELVANWNDTVRQILEDSDFDLYFKPFYAFVFAIVAGTSAAAATAPAQANVSAAVATAVPPAPEEGLPWLVWVWNIITAGAAGFGTWVLCSFRSKVASTLRSIPTTYFTCIRWLSSQRRRHGWRSCSLPFWYQFWRRCWSPFSWPWPRLFGQFSRDWNAAAAIRALRAA